jgi:hypothetical protein
MNSLEALAVAARDGAHIVHVPSWQAEADLAAGHLVRRRAGGSSIAPDVSAVAAGFAEDQGLRRLSGRAQARHRFARRQPMNRTNIQFLNNAK